MSNVDGWSGRLNVAYSGEQIVKEWDAQTFTTQRVERGGFTVADVSVSKRIYVSEQAGDVSITGNFRNLTDKDYSYVKNYPIPGRSYFVNMRYRF